MAGLSLKFVPGQGNTESNSLSIEDKKKLINDAIISIKNDNLLSIEYKKKLIDGANQLKNKEIIQLQHSDPLELTYFDFKSINDFIENLKLLIPEPTTGGRRKHRTRRNKKQRKHRTRKH